jgi:DnaJ-class molecular chaperone
MPTPYETLGIESTADDATIKKAYKSKAQSSHPDKEGGDAALFKLVKEAYELLSNKERRRMYDETGYTHNGNIDSDARSGISALVTVAVDQLDESNTDIIQTVRDKIIEMLGQNQLAIDGVKKTIRKRQNAVKRMRRRSGEANFVATVLEGTILNETAGLQQLEYNRKVLERTIEILVDFEYSVDVKVADLSATFGGMRFFGNAR